MGADTEGDAAMESLYPFLYSDKTDLPAVMAQVRASTVAKVGEIVDLRREVSVLDGARRLATDLYKAELQSIRTLHLGKKLALDLTQTAFDVCGARAAFRSLELERLYRDVRTFSLHYRDEQYMVQVGQAMLDREFHAKGYAGASTFPESRA